MDDWTMDKWMGFFRHILTSFGGIVAYLGYLDEGSVEMLVGAGMTLIGFVWSWKSK